MRGMAHADGLCELALLCTPACLEHWSNLHLCMHAGSADASACSWQSSWVRPYHACLLWPAFEERCYSPGHVQVYILLFWLKCIPCVCGVRKYAPTWRVMQECGFESMQKHFENCMVTCWRVLHTSESTHTSIQVARADVKLNHMFFALKPSCMLCFECPCMRCIQELLQDYHPSAPQL